MFDIMNRAIVTYFTMNVALHFSLHSTHSFSDKHHLITLQISSNKITSIAYLDLFK